MILLPKHIKIKKANKMNEFIITEEYSVLEAMEHLDKVAKKVLFVVDNKKLIAALTDGDIRRWILKKGDLNASIKNVANYSPKYLIECNKKEAIEYMKNNYIEALPILDRNEEIKSIILWNDKEFTFHRTKLDLPVVMMAGGMGKRLYPYTNILPKPLIPVGETPIAELIINQFRKYGCKEFHLVVNYKKNMIKAYFNEIDKDYDIYYADEYTPLGTGGGLSLLKGKITSSFILTNCDVLIEDNFAKIYKLHKEQGHLITMVCSLKNYIIPYGIVDINENGDIEAMREKPKLSFFTNTGCYIVEPEVIDILEENTPIDFPNIIEKIRMCGGSVGIYPIGENAWLDMGQIDGLEKVSNRFDI